MIVEMTQNRRRGRFIVDYHFDEGERHIGDATAQEKRDTDEPRGTHVDLTLTGGWAYKMYLSLFEPSAKFEDRFSFKLMSPSGERLGHIIGRTRKTGRFFGGYIFYELQFKETLYEVYEVGLGKKGLFLCIYEGDTLRAVIEKDLVVVNFRDKYTMYFKDREMLPIAAFFALYYDITKYSNLYESAVYSRREYRVISTNKELLAKFDADFIRQVRELEEGDVFDAQGSRPY